MSNRLPVTLEQNNPASNAKRSIGGLATGIDSYVKKVTDGQTPFTSCLWFGWPGFFAKGNKTESTVHNVLQANNYYPVFLSERLVEGFYYQFCNRVIWPLFHGFPNHVNYNHNSWEMYVKANEFFYATLKKSLKADDFVWIHDYHLMLLPGLIRQDFPDIKINFFLHIPFPGINLFRHMAKVEQAVILKGMLGADSVGFHTAEYRDDFLKAVSQVMGIYTSENILHVNNRKVKVGVFPMGIDYYGIKDIAQSDDCLLQKSQIKADMADRKIVLSVDRLDYTKGIINRLMAFNQLLADAYWHQKVVLVLVVAPSRHDVDAYVQMKKEIDEWVGKINGLYSTNMWLPVIYKYRQMDLMQLSALYSASDVCLITPLCDGMNLIAKEFIASNKPENGVLILSEMAGAVKELTNALPVNPFCVDEMVVAIKQALTMPSSEICTRNTIMHNQLKNDNVLTWADKIVNETLTIPEEVLV